MSHCAVEYVQYDITFGFWDRVRLLFGLPIHVRVEIEAGGALNVTVVPKGARPKTLVTLKAKTVKDPGRT